MHRLRLVTSFIGLVIIPLSLVSCQSGGTQKTVNVTIVTATPKSEVVTSSIPTEIATSLPPKEAAKSASASAPKPASGKAVFTGVVISEKTGKPYQNCLVRLAEIFGTGENQGYAYDAAQSPGAMTDQNGAFIIPDITPKSYVFILLDPNNFDHYVVAHDPSMHGNIYTAEANKTLDMGVISIDFDK